MVLGVGSFAIIKESQQPVRITRRWRPSSKSIWRWHASNGCQYLGRDLICIEESDFAVAQHEWDLLQAAELDRRVSLLAF